MFRIKITRRPGRTQGSGGLNDLLRIKATIQHKAMPPGQQGQIDAKTQRAGFAGKALQFHFLGFRPDLPARAFQFDDPGCKRLPLLFNGGPWWYKITRLRCAERPANVLADVITVALYLAVENRLLIKKCNRTVADDQCRSLSVHLQRLIGLIVNENAQLPVGPAEIVADPAGVVLSYETMCCIHWRFITGQTIVLVSRTGGDGKEDRKIN